LEEPQEYLKLFTTKWTPLAFRESAAGVGRSGKNRVYCVSIAVRLKSRWRCYGFYRQIYEEEDEGGEEKEGGGGCRPRLKYFFIYSYRNRIERRKCVTLMT